MIAVKIQLNKILKLRSKQGSQGCAFARMPKTTSCHVCGIPASLYRIHPISTKMEVDKSQRAKGPRWCTPLFFESPVFLTTERRHFRTKGSALNSMMILNCYNFFLTFLTGKGLFKKQSLRLVLARVGKLVPYSKRMGYEGTPLPFETQLRPSARNILGNRSNSQALLCHDFRNKLRPWLDMEIRMQRRGLLHPWNL